MTKKINILNGVVKKLTQLILLAIVVLFTNSCEKTYDDGPRLTFRSPMKRILGTWELVSIEGTERIEPGKRQYISFYEQEIYKARNISHLFFDGDIQGIECRPMPVEQVYGGNGWWYFYSGGFTENCQVTETLKENEGVCFAVQWASNMYHGYCCKILKLTNKKLVLKTQFCNTNSQCEEDYPNSVIFNFKKL